MAAATAVRRTVRFDTIDDILTDAENAVGRGAATTGNWSLGQIIQHVVIVMNPQGSKTRLGACVDNFSSRS